MIIQKVICIFDKHLKTTDMKKTTQQPKPNEFYLAFDTAWFSAFYNSKGIWTYNGREIFPTHWVELPSAPLSLT